MSTKSILLSIAAMLSAASIASAQSLLDLPGLLGRQQTRSQDNAVKVEYDIDFQYFFDLRAFGASNEIFMSNATLNVARFSPSAMLRFDQGDATHRLALGIDLTKNLGVNPTSVAVYSDAEHEARLGNIDLMRDIFFYYNYRRRIGKGILDLYAGIHPRTVLEGDYTRAIFADDLRYYDPNLEGITFKYSAPRFSAEITADLVGKRGVDRVGQEMVFTAGGFKPADWATIGWSASYAHTVGTYLASTDTDFAVLNPFGRIDFGPRIGIQELSLKAGPLFTYQLDYSMTVKDENGDYVGDDPHFPMGAEIIFNVRHWGLGLENTYYYGDNINTYRESAYIDITSADTYAPSLYTGETFYFTRRSVPTWYDRLELYWQPLSSDFVKARFSGVGHFITPAGQDPADRIGPFIGMQAKATLLFDLDAFRHPRETASRSRNRGTQSSRSISSDGPVLSL